LSNISNINLADAIWLHNALERLHLVELRRCSLNLESKINALSYRCRVVNLQVGQDLSLGLILGHELKDGRWLHPDVLLEVILHVDHIYFEFFNLNYL